MKRLIYHIKFWLPGILLVVLAVANASAQQGIVVDQCDTMEFSVTSRPSINESHFVWDIYNSSPNPTDVLDYAAALDHVQYFVGDNYNTGRTVKVTNLDIGTYYVRIEVWDEIKCTNNVEMYVLEVIEHIPEVEIVGDSVCIGEPAIVKIIFTGIGPYTIDYTYGDAITGNIVNMNGVVVDGPEYTVPILNPLPEGENTFWIIRIEDDCRAYEFPEEERPKGNILIYPKPRHSQIYQIDK